MSGGAEEIRRAINDAVVLAFPRPASASQTDQTGSEGQAGGTGSGTNDPPPAEPDGRDPNLEFAHFPQTDLGNGERFSSRYRSKIRYCPALGWLVWDGRRWAQSGAEEQVKLAEQATARAIQDEAKAVKETPGVDCQFLNSRGKQVWLSETISAWGRASENAARLSAMSKIASAKLAISIDQLDRDPFKITVLNGTLSVGRDVPEGYVQLGPHEPDDYITRLAPINFDPAAACPLFERFMEDIQPSSDMRVFLASWFGYALTGNTDEQKMVFFYGTGRNGKGVLVNLMAHIAGDFADAISIESFLDSGRARAGGQPTPDLAGLPGVRLLTTSEPKKGAKLDEALIKLFTGGDRIKARHLNKGFFSFVPQAKLTMQGNYRPAVRDTDEGMWSRIKLVPFGIFIPKERRDPALLEKLKAEAPGVLNWMLDGLRRWFDAGALVFPDEVDQATSRFRDESDPLGAFIEACTTPSRQDRVQASRMYQVYSAWAKANGETIWSIKGFGSALRERGFKTMRSSGSWWQDVKLTKHVTDFMDADEGER